jgi:Na+/H+-dicarboxylate symporter
VFLGLLLLLAIFATVAAPLLFQYLTVDAGAAESIRSSADTLVRPPLPSFASWLVSAVPVNPIRAAVDGAMLPLVVFALLFGLALGRLPTARREPASAVFRSIADAMLVLVSWILAVAPIGIFALALPLAARLGSGVVGAVGFYLAAHSGLLLAGTLVLYVIIAVVSRAPLGRFARAALAPQLVAVTTRSSLAALPANVVAAERGLGLPSGLASFALPLAVSVFRLNQPISWLAMALFASKLYGVELGVASIVTLAVTSVLMSFSVPGIPSGSLFIVAPFFAAHGIPPESIGVLIALDLVPDVFKTLCNVTGHLTAVTLLHDTVSATAESG